MGSLRNKDVVQRLHRIEGQVRGLVGMVEEDRYCLDVLTQVASASKALQQVGVHLLNDHLHHCMGDAVAAGDAQMREQNLSDAVAAIERLLKV